MRSRWFGSMFAWILNTSAVRFGSFASHHARIGRLRARARAVLGQAVEQVGDADLA